MYSYITWWQTYQPLVVTSLFLDSMLQN